MEWNPDPILQFESWFKLARGLKTPTFVHTLITRFFPTLGAVLEPEAAALATATKTGRPSARFVLFKGLKDKGFSFYTNTKSQKAVELAENPQAALVFYWPLPPRQIRIEGHVEKMNYEETSLYWNTRPRGSQISGTASPQSQAISSREELEKIASKVAEQFQGKQIPCPQDWSGYYLIPDRIEFWQGHKFRLHDRCAYERTDTGWRRTLLAP